VTALSLTHCAVKYGPGQTTECTCASVIKQYDLELARKDGDTPKLGR